MVYQLMHRETPVAVIGINDDTGTIYKLEKLLCPEHLPVGISASKNKQLVQELNYWFSGRAIPASRSGFRAAVEGIALSHNLQLTPTKLLMNCYGLSLSDQYWVNPVSTPLTWQNVNFYNNPFSDDVGDILFGRVPDSKVFDLMSPCNASDGWLRKKWKIINGQRMLIKGGSGMTKQEPFNEVLASLLCSRLNIPHVPYHIIQENGDAYSACPNLTTDRQDLVSAFYLCSGKSENTASYSRFIEICKELEIPNAQHSINQMIVLDFLLANTDRHWGNFGAIRDAVTLEWVGMAPIFDSGTSMWNDSYGSQIDPFANIQARPFAPMHNQQLELIKGDADWIDFSVLKDIQEEAYTIYEQANFAEPHRAEILSKAVSQRCEHLQQLIREITPPMVSLADRCAEATQSAQNINQEKTTCFPSSELERT